MTIYTCNGRHVIAVSIVFDKFLGCINFHGFFNSLQEPDVLFGVSDERRASLLMMNFSVNEINFAMDKLGM